jgi:glycosyltransferase involved in cell wall biosynthesis
MPEPAQLRLAYFTNNALGDKIPGLSFSIFTVEGFHQAGSDCRLILHRRGKESSADILRRRFDLNFNFKIAGLRAPKIGGSRQLFYWRAFFHLLAGDRNVLIARAVNFLPWAVRWKQIRRTRVFFEAHDFWSDPALREDPVTRGRKRYVRLERTWLPQVDGIICVSRPQAKLYRRCYPGKTVITANTACRPPSSATRREYSFTLGYIGYFKPEKYPLDIVIKALSHTAIKQATLICIGAIDQRPSEHLIRLARKYSVAHRLHIYPWTTGQDLEKLKQRIDVGIVVMTDDFLNRIASPMKLLEYMSTGIPFIASDLEGTRALVGGGQQGLLVKNEPRAWAGAIDRIYADFHQYEQMAAGCRRYARVNSWRHRAETILNQLGQEGGRGAVVPR